VWVYRNINYETANERPPCIAYGSKKPKKSHITSSFCLRCQSWDNRCLNEFPKVNKKEKEGALTISKSEFRYTGADKEL
jgi:hypothetical protein